jgi:hypothetical protein
VTRLDSFIRRLEAQRACLDRAVELTHGLPGAALELGLGNGRTYDHLRARLGESRELYALDRKLAAHPDCVPAAPYLVLGEFRLTLPRLARRIGRSVALAHADTGTGDEAASRVQARRLAPMLDPLLVAGAVIASDQDMAPAPGVHWLRLALPRGIARGRYWLWRKRR